MLSRTEIPGADGVLDGFLAAAGRHPERAAIVHNGQTVAYAELEALVRAVAQRLGPRPGVVGVHATHSLGTVTGLLGVWAAGGTYCPIDPTFPAARRQTMLAAASCRILLDAGSQPASADDVRLSEITAGAGPGEPDETAYILFTSGSTGEPKPVMTPRTAIAAVVGSLRDLFDLTPGDRVLQFASLNWDTCFEEILPTLTSGACLMFHEDAYTGSFPRLLRMVEREQITVLDLPTAYWHELVNHLIEEGAPLPECVRLVIIGGESASPARLADWRSMDIGHARLVNTYGCTETTLITHAVDLHGPLVTDPPTGMAAVSRVPIGRALPHVVEHIADTGELLIGGPALASGYRGMAQATDARFVTVGGHRFFRTGDRVRALPDGTLEHSGRIDAEIKIRGVRVDPAEVEAHIAGHPAVSAVAVTGVAVADHTVLVAYVVPRPLATMAGLDAGILDYLRGRVPAHLIPNRIHVVADLAYTASGKVDRHRIKEALA